MNEKEVIKVLKRFYPTEIVLKSDSTGMIHENKEALDIAIESVKKQIPMQVYLQGDGYSNGELVIDTAICENCNAHYEIDSEHYKYCPNCGQRLDWLEVEE